MELCWKKVKASIRAREAGTGLEKTAVVEGEPFVVVGIPAFNEERTIARVVLQAQKYADKVFVCDDGAKAEKNLKSFE